MNKLIENIKELDANWMHKTKHEKVTAIREAVVDLDNLVSSDQISQGGISFVLGGINVMLNRLHDEVEEV